MPSSHFDSDGNAHMVDVSGKPITKRTATASSTVRMSREAAEQVRGGTAKKGDVLSVARLAAINSTKWTPHLIPLCHAIPIESVAVDFQWADVPTDQGQDLSCDLVCHVTCGTSGKTGIEMEAITGASVAALTIYDMLKSVDRRMQIGPIHLDAKHGGASGDFSRE